MISLYCLKNNFGRFNFEPYMLLEKIKINILFKVLLSFLLLFALTLSLTFVFYRVLFPIKEYLLLIANSCTYASLMMVVFLLLRLWKIPISDFFWSITLKCILWIICLTFVIKFLIPFFTLTSFFPDLLENKMKIFGFQSYNFLMKINEHTQLHYDVSSLIVAPFFEEILFRGIFIKKITEKYSPAIAILFSSLLFGLYHMDFEQSVYAFFIGIILGIIYFKTKNLSLVIVIHFLNNLLSLFLVEKTIHLMGLNVLLFCTYPVLLFLLYVIIKKLISINLKTNL